MTHIAPVAPRLASLGTQARVRGEYVRAERLLRAAVAVAETADEEPRDDHTLVAALNQLGMLCKELARYDEGLAVYHRALALVDGSPAFSRADRASLQHDLAGTAWAMGRLAEAESTARAGLAMRIEAGDGASVEAASDMIALAAIVDARRQDAEAEALYRDGLRLLQCDPVGNAPEIAVALNGLGAHYVRRGMLEPATDMLEQALAIKRRVLDARHPDIALAMNNLAMAWKYRGERARATALFADAVALLDRGLGPMHPRTVACRWNYRRCVAASETRRVAGVT